MDLFGARCQHAQETRIIEERFIQKGLVTFAHMDYPKLVARGYVRGEFDKRSFKFSFVRNPYDRAVSLFYYFRRKKHIREDIDFLGFARLLRDGAVPDIGLFNRNGISLANPQARWLRGIKLDFIGRNENIDNDVKELFGKLGFTAPPPTPHKNATPHPEWVSCYCDESASIVRDFYRQDFDQFEYPDCLPAASRRASGDGDSLPISAPG